MTLSLLLIAFNFEYFLECITSKREKFIYFLRDWAGNICVSLYQGEGWLEKKHKIELFKNKIY